MALLSDSILDILRRLPHRPDAKRAICLIPLAGIYWQDEMPSVADMVSLSENERNTIWGLFASRDKIWDGEPLTPEAQKFWDAARAAVPDWALFHRLTLSDDDKRARSEAEAAVEAEFESAFGDAN